MDVWYDKDVALEKIKKEVIAVIGYGIQGHAQASNMKDSGLNVIVGLRKNGASWDKAVKDGHEVYEVAEAAKKSADKIYNRIMVTHLLMDESKENRVGGAVGFNCRTGDYHVFRAKAVIVGAGGASHIFKPRSVGEIGRASCRERV